MRIDRRKQAVVGTYAMEIEDVQMQIQSNLCQLGVKDPVEIAKTLGCSDGDTKEKNSKGLVRLIEEKFEGTLRVQIRQTK